MIRRLIAPLVVASLSVACAAPEVEHAERVEHTAEAWAAGSATDEAKSTHLFIVDRAITMLATTSDPRAAAMRTFMNEPVCRSQWQQGLLDADYIRFYNQGGKDLVAGQNIIESALMLATSGTTWESHFYDPDTGLNYKGNNVTARAQAARYLSLARAAAFHDGAVHATEWGWDGSVYQAHDLDYATCYVLGLSLHYFTDMTQGQHASNFTALSAPAMLHSDYEDYAESIQDRVRSRPMPPFAITSDSADAILFATARASKAQWGTTFDAIKSARRSRCPLEEMSPKDSKLCWIGDPTVDGLILDALDAARAATARYLVAIADLATPTPSTLIGDAYGVTSVSYHLNGIYVTSGSQLWRRGSMYANSGNDWTSAGSAYGVTAMVSHDGDLYVASADHLWKRTGDAWTEAGLAYGVTAMASANGSLYAVSNDHLWKRGALGAGTGNDWTDAGLAYGVHGMTAWNGQLYVVSNEMLWRRGALGPGTGNDWTPVAYLPTVNGIASTEGMFMWLTTTDNQLRRVAMPLSHP